MSIYLTAEPWHFRRGRTEDHPVKVGSSFSATDISKNAPHYDGLIPKLNFREPKGDFCFELSIAWVIGTATAIQFIASNCLSCVEAPDLSKYHKLSLEDKSRLRNLKKNDQPENSDEVQAIIQKVIPINIAQLKSEWENIETQDVQAKRDFLRRVEDDYAATYHVEATDVPYLETVKKNTLASLDELRLNIAEKIIGTPPAKEWKEKLEQLKKAPIDKDFTTPFKLYAELEDKIKELQNTENEQSPTLRALKNKYLSDLNALALKEAILHVLADKKEEARDALERKMNTFAKDQLPPTTTLSQEGSFGEKYSGYLAQLNAQVQAARKDKISAVGNLQKALNQVNTAREQYTTAKNKVFKEAPSATQNYVNNAISALIAESNRYIDEIHECEIMLQSQEDARDLLLQIQAGQLKEGGWRGWLKTTVPFTEEDREALLRLDPEISAIKLKKGQLENKLEACNQKISEQMDRRPEIEQLVQKTEQRLTEEAEQSTEYKELLEAQEKHSTAKIEVQKAQHTLKALHSSLDSAQNLIKDNCQFFEAQLKRFVELAHIEQAFKKCCKSDEKKQPSDWIAEDTCLSEDNQALLVSIFGVELPNTVNDKVKQVISQMVIVDDH